MSKDNDWAEKEAEIAHKAMINLPYPGTLEGEIMIIAEALRKVRRETIEQTVAILQDDKTNNSPEQAIKAIRQLEGLNG